MSGVFEHGEFLAHFLNKNIFFFGYRDAKNNVCDRFFRFMS